MTSVFYNNLYVTPITIAILEQVYSIPFFRNKSLGPAHKERGLPKNLNAERLGSLGDILEVTYLEILVCLFLLCKKEKACKHPLPTPIYHCLCAVLIHSSSTITTVS